MPVNEELWIVVLAGGEGTRLAPLTRALYGVDLPKQFAVLSGENSLLQETVGRAALLAPPERVMVVVSAHHEERAREQLANHPQVQLIVQPRSLDTAPAILVAIARIRSIDPQARVAIMPADHYFDDHDPLLDLVRESGSGPARDRVALIGVVPDHPETEYGWIERGQPLGRSGQVFSVRRFKEKPDAETCAVLRARGALWNTFISVGPVSVFWRLARRHLPVHTHLLDVYRLQRVRVGEKGALEALYRDMPPANFSADVLSHARGLAVLPMSGTGWSDWGSPARVFESLAGTQDHALLLHRMASRHEPQPQARALAN